MGKVADSAAIQCRTLNESKGDAVRSTRFQVDKVSYASNAKKFLLESSSIELIESELVDIVFEENLYTLHLKDGVPLSSKKVVMTVGTFLGGRLHCGAKITPGGGTTRHPQFLPLISH